ncbi:hypothetical protein B0T16DRAFT_454836 [Cercophora newfieldiana]|uniref:F-box domain-containing protein n=1 Tax=Cercophora newfieldiana TaxID=92897 RepID=A0AA39YH06_9PEZI|nr:hypothetical protein B0T16DRAFT_454836 [Cercophora newfieldiana]
MDGRPDQRDDPPFERPVQPANAVILRLPDELLLKIVNNLFPFDPNSNERYGLSHREKYADRDALSKTCVRFYRLAVHSMYTDLEVYLPYYPHLSHSAMMTVPQAEKLCDTLAKNPSFRLHCRSLRFFFDCEHYTARDRDIITTLIRLLTQTKSFAVIGAFESDCEDDWGTIQDALGHMPLLEELSLTGRGDDAFPLLNICAKLDGAKSLRVLTLNGNNSAEVDETLLRDTSRERSSPITSLHICEFWGRPENLTKFLKWPARLESFSFRGMSSEDTDSGGVWSLQTLLAGLRPHSASLKTLLLENRETLSLGLAGCDLTGFDALEKLQLSHWVTGNKVDPSWGLLNAPHLQEFCWSLTLRCLGTEHIADFKEEEDAWLRALTAAVVARKLPLKKVRIKYISLSEVHGEWVTDQRDRLDRLERDMGAEGISFSCDTLPQPEWVDIHVITCDNILED